LKETEISAKSIPSCHLWHALPPNRKDVLAVLESVASYFREYHETRDLLRCKRCGQLYFCEWREEMRFDGEDSQDYVLIPVADAAEGLALSQMSRMQRLCRPSLVMVFPPSDAKPYWVNR
jgi:hypothetical protein